MTNRWTWRLLGAWLLLGGFTCVRTGLAQQPCPDVEVAGSYVGTAIDPGVDDLGLHCDDCTAPVTFPFPVRLYGMDFTSAMVSSNGNVQFAGASTQYQDECLPTTNMDTAVFPLWDDLVLTDPGDGVFTSTTGTAPSRVFNIEWRAHYFGQAGTANFEVRFFENSRNFEFVYGTYTGQTYTIGVQKGRGELDRYIRCNFANPLPPGTTFVFSDTYTGSRSSFTSLGRSFPQGVTDTGNHCDDCTTAITLPFPVGFYGQTYTSANVSSNGNLQFASANAGYANVCPPAADFGPTIFAHWDDLLTDTPGSGVFTNVSGAAPFRTFDVEWRATYFSGGGSVNFTIRFFEGLDYIELYFNSAAEHGAGATLGTQAGDERYLEMWCDTLNSANPGDLYTLSLPPMRVIAPSSYVPPCTTDMGNHCDDCTTALALPFTVSLFGAQFTTANISSNGNIQFESNLSTYTNSCLPSAAFGTTIFAYWDDLRTDSAPGSGVYTRIFGTAPNRQLGIEWRATSFATGGAANFEVVLYETIPRFDLLYGSLPDGGASATAGVQHGGGPEFLQYSCNATGRQPVWVQYLCVGGPPAPCAPAITEQPQNATACPNGNATFSVTATGSDPLTYRWEIESAPGVWQGLGNDPFPLPCGGFAYASMPFSNQTPIGIHPCPGINSYQIRCVVSNACGSVTSNEATYSICAADFNCDGVANSQDFFDFLAAFFAGTPNADFNGDGVVNSQDFFDFLTAFFGGCQ